MAFYDQQILAGLSKIPAPGCPGGIVIFGNKAQPIFTGPRAGDVFLAAAEYGTGRIFVSAHDCYLNWLSEKSGLKKEFMENVKKWLVKDDGLKDSEIGDLKDFSDAKSPFEKYRLIKWHHSKQISDSLQNKLLNYLEKGGALICGATPWGFLQVNKKKTLKDMDMYVFLKNFVGIIFTEGYIGVATEIPVENNQAKFSNFNSAIGKVKCDIKKINKYCATIECGLDVLQKENLVDEDSLKTLMQNLLCECDEKHNNAYPCGKKPIRDSEHKNVVKLICTCMLHVKGVKAPNVAEFPGDFKQEPVLLDNVQVELDTKFEERLSTGYYLPAGVEMVVEVVSGEWKGWDVRIGAHTDNLSGCEQYSRWPVVTVKRQVEKGFSVCSPFGGLVYFESPKEASICVRLSNVVEAPYIDKTRPETVQNWTERRNAPGLWAELAGERVIITCPSECVKSLDTAAEALELIDFWDSVVECHHKLRGSNPNKYKRERIVNDKQASAGYMHSGYPIVTHLDVCDKKCAECMFDVARLKKKGTWGLFHEIGHNLQRAEWTFDGCGEVTVNLFSMHAMKFIVGKDVLEQAWILDQKGHFKPFFAKKPSYNAWKENCHIALMTFVQLIKHFGWEPMRKFMDDYEDDIKKKTNLPKSNQDKIDQWVLRYSKIIERNIRPQFELWGLPVSDSVDEKLKDLPEWCPKEDIYPDPLNFFKQP